MSAERDFESPTEAGMLMPITRRPQNVFRDENEVHTIPRSPEKSSAHNHYFASTDVAESCESCESSQSDTITRSDDVLDGHEYKTRTGTKLRWRILEPVASARRVCNVPEDFGLRCTY
jgi:hypothetical protein